MPALLNFVLESTVSLLCVIDLHHALMHAQTPRRAAHRAPRDWGQTTVHTDTGAVRRVGTPRRRARVADAVRTLGVWFVYLCVRPLVDGVLAWFVPFCGTLQTVWLLWMLANRSTVRGVLTQAPSLVFQRIVRPTIARYEGAIDRATLWAHGLVLFLGFVLSRLVAPLRRAVAQSIPGRLRTLVHLRRADPVDAMEETAQELSQGPWMPPSLSSLSTPIVPGRFAWREGKRATPRKASPSTPSARLPQMPSRSARTPRTPRTPRAAQRPSADAAPKTEEDTPELASTSTAAHAADALRAARVPKEIPDHSVAPSTVKDEPSASQDVAQTASPKAELRRSQETTLAGHSTARATRPTQHTAGTSDDAPHTPEPVSKDEDAAPASESAESVLMRMLTERASRPTKRAPQTTPSPAAKRARRAPQSTTSDFATKRALRDAEQPAEAQDTPPSASVRGRRSTTKHAPESASMPAPKRRLRETHTSGVGSAKRVTTTVRTEPDSLRPSARAGAPRGRTASQTSLLPRPARASVDEAPELRRSTRTRTKRAP